MSDKQQGEHDSDIDITSSGGLGSIGSSAMGDTGTGGMDQGLGVDEARRGMDVGSGMGGTSSTNMGGPVDTRVDDTGRGDQNSAMGDSDSSSLGGDSRERDSSA